MAVVTNSSDRGGAADARPSEAPTDRTAAERAAHEGGGHASSSTRADVAAEHAQGAHGGPATEAIHDHHEPMTQDAILNDRDHPVQAGEGPGAGQAAVAGTLPRIGIILIIFAAGWLSVTAVQSLQNIVGPLLLTLNLAIVAYPVQGWLNRYGIPKIIGACVSGAIIFAIVLAFFGALGWSLTMLIQEIPQYQKQFTDIYRQIIDQLSKYGISETQAMQQLQSQLDPSRVVSLATQTLSGLTGTLSLLLVTVTIIFVVLIDSMNLTHRMRIAATAHADLVDALVGFARGVRRYWVVSSVFGAIVAALDIAALVWLGVPLALVWGLLSFLTNYIPNIGFVIGIVPPTLMGLLAGGPKTALLVVVAYCVINFVIQSIIQPKFLGDAVGVTATVSLLSLFFWAWVLGPLGALLALPATLLCKALLIDLDPRMRWLDAFIASDPERGNQVAKGRAAD